MHGLRLSFCVLVMLIFASVCRAQDMESGVDRFGADFKGVSLQAARPELCLSQCEQDNNCKAWTYVKPGPSAQAAQCFLKNSVPPPVQDACCISGVKGIDYNTDRFGSDYKSLALNSPDPALCQAACGDDPMCASWTYGKPGVRGPSAICWLKRDILTPRYDACCESGLSPAACESLCYGNYETATEAKVVVPATASSVEGIRLKAGHNYVLRASGKIRVGVIFEGDTEPTGWDQEAGDNFPAPGWNKYALIYKIDKNGRWKSLTGKAAFIHADRLSTLYLGINDDRLDDNRGAFTASITEYGFIHACCSAGGGSWTGIGGGGTGETSTSTGGTSTGTSGTNSSGTGGSTPKGPCAGTTSNGALLQFNFGVYCGSSRNGEVVGQGCDRPQALTWARNTLPYGCFINETEGTPIAIPLPPTNTTETCTTKTFQLCVACNDGGGDVDTSVYVGACTEDGAKTSVLIGRPYFCRVDSVGACKP